MIVRRLPASRARHLGKEEDIVRPLVGLNGWLLSRTAGWVTALWLVHPVTLGAEGTRRTERAPGLQKAVFRTPDGSVTV
jgi:hypothetical protein